jgi:type I restriction enzyme M protein
MYDELILVLNQSYRKFKEKEKDPALFFHFLALLALKYIYDNKDRLYPFKPDASQAESLRLVFSPLSEASKAPLLDKVIGQLSKKYAATLAHIFENISFRELIAGKKKEADGRLSTLTTEIAELTFSTTAGSNSYAAVIGSAIEYLIEKFAEENFHKSGFLYTPRSISKLMAELADLDESVRVYDPAAGLGTILIQAAFTGNLNDYKLFGQEANPMYAQLCRFNMLFYGLIKAEIETGNSLQESKFTSGKKLMQFDRIITHPPFLMESFLPSDPEQLFDKKTQKKSPIMILEEPAPVYKRNKESLEDRENAPNENFLTHILSSLTEDGKAVIIVPHGVLFKLGNAQMVRRQLVFANMVEAIIDLPANIFYSSKVNVSILILNKKKPHTNLLFIDASKLFQPDRRRNKLRDEHLKQILKAFTSFTTVNNYAYKATLQEITEKSNDYNLTAKRYVKETIKPAAQNLDTIRQNINQLSVQLETIRKNLEKEITSLE